MIKNKEILQDYFNKIEKIDTHEHFPSLEITKNEYMTFAHLVAPYLSFEILNVSKNTDFFKFYPKNEIEENLFIDHFLEYYEYIRFTSAFLPIKMIINDLCGNEPMSKELLLKVSSKLRTNDNLQFINYREKNNIKHIFTVSGEPDKINDFQVLYNVENFIKEKILNVEDFDLACKLLENEIKNNDYNNVVALKFWAPTLTKMKNFINTYQWLADKWFEKESRMEVALFQALNIANEILLPIQIHCGYWDGLEGQNPVELEFIYEMVGSTIDILHCGIPYFNEAIFMAKKYNNVYINLTWVPLLSKTIAKEIFTKSMDVLPITKITAFGGDVKFLPVHSEKILDLTFEIISEVLLEKINTNEITCEDAKYVIKKVFYDNPYIIYNLK